MKTSERPESLSFHMGNIAHVDDNFKSLSIDLTEEDLHDLDTAFPAPIRKIPLAGW